MACPREPLQDFLPMSLNNHGLPSRVPIIAELGRLFADPAVPDADKQQALDLLVQDHVDLDDVEAQSALWAISQLGRSEMGCHALLDCAPAWLALADTAQPFLDAYLQTCGSQVTVAAKTAFAQLHTLARHDAELAARLPDFAGPCNS